MIITHKYLDTYFGYKYLDTLFADIHNKKKIKKKQ